MAQARRYEEGNMKTMVACALREERIGRGLVLSRHITDLQGLG